MTFLQKENYFCFQVFIAEPAGKAGQRISIAKQIC